MRGAIKRERKTQQGPFVARLRAGNEGRNNGGGHRHNPAVFTIEQPQEREQTTVSSEPESTLTVTADNKRC